MKSLVATVLLLFQLQPVAGSAACLFSSEQASNPECEMPEQRAGAQGSLLQSGSPTQGCALAFVCARSAIAVPSLSDSQESILPLHSDTTTPATETFTDVVSVPPFHPPRA